MLPVVSVGVSGGGAVAPLAAVDAVVARQVDEAPREGAVGGARGHEVDAGVAVVAVPTDGRRVVVVGLDVASVAHRVVRRVGHHLHTATHVKLSSSRGACIIIIIIVITITIIIIVIIISLLLFFYNFLLFIF